MGSGVMKARLTIGHKLVVAFGILIVLSGVNAFVGTTGLNDVVRTFEDETLRIAETARLTEALEKHVYAQGHNVSTYTLMAADNYREGFNAAVRGAEETVDALRRQVRSEEARRLVEEAAGYLDAYAAVAARMLDGTLVHGTAAWANAALSMARTRGELVEAVDALADYQARRLHETTLEAEAAIARARAVMTVVAVIVLIGGAVVSFVLTRNISGPVREVARVAEQLAEGDLSVEGLRISGRDEIGEMAGSINRMLGNWRAAIEQIRKTGEALKANGQTVLAAATEATDATGQIAAAIHQVAQGTRNQLDQVQETRAAMEQLRGAIDQIVSGAHEQARQAEQTSRSLERMAQSIEHVAKSADQVAQAAARGAESARAGEEAVDQVVDGMAGVRTSVARVAERIDELGDYSRQIGQIVQMISDIADQTNLLALNAAIEAARAGEHGRGFGVVADEVRQLAERAAASAGDIRDLIESIQRAVDAAVADMNEGRTRAEAGTELASNARAALDDITEAIRATDRLARTISEAAEHMAAMGPQMLAAMAEMASVTEENTAATEEMAASSDQVMRSMEQVSFISEQTAAGTEEVSASTEQVNSAAADMQSSMQALAKMAADLGELVGRFRV